MHPQMTQIQQIASKKPARSKLLHADGQGGFWTVGRQNYFTLRNPCNLRTISRHLRYRSHHASNGAYSRLGR